MYGCSVWEVLSNLTLSANNCPGLLMLPTKWGRIWREVVQVAFWPGIQIPSRAFLDVAAFLNGASKNEANAQRTLPVFMPSFQVAENTAYGHEIYLKAAALTDSEIVACTGKPPISLGMSPWQCDWTSPQSNNNLYLVSLADLPENMRYTARRVKIFHSVQASRDKLQLTPSTMLSLHQHHSVGGKCLQFDTHVFFRCVGLEPPTILK